MYVYMYKYIYTFMYVGILKDGGEAAQMYPMARQLAMMEIKKINHDLKF
jgi:hypothetical protein